MAPHLTPHLPLQILKATAALNDSAKEEAEVLDPLTGKAVVRPDASAAGVLRAHFSPSEWAVGAKGAALGKLKGLVAGRLALAKCL